MFTGVEDSSPGDGGPAGPPSLIDEIVREGARRMLAAAWEAEVDAYLAELAGERDERGRRLVVRNGHAQPRTVRTSAGAVEVVAARVNDKRVDPDSGNGAGRRSCRHGQLVERPTIEKITQAA